MDEELLVWQLKAQMIFFKDKTKHSTASFFLAQRHDLTGKAQQALYEYLLITEDSRGSNKTTLEYFLEHACSLTEIQTDAIGRGWGERMIENPRLSPAAQMLLVETENFEIIGRILAQNRDLILDEEAANYIAESNFSYTPGPGRKYGISGSANTTLADLLCGRAISESTQMILLKKGNAEIKEELLNTPNLSENVVMLLLKDKNAEVQRQTYRFVAEMDEEELSEKGWTKALAFVNAALLLPEGNWAKSY